MKKILEILPKIILIIIVGFFVCMFTIFGLGGLQMMDTLNYILTIIFVVAIWSGFIYLIYSLLFKNRNSLSIDK